MKIQIGKKIDGIRNSTLKKFENKGLSRKISETQLRWGEHMRKMLQRRLIK